MTTNEALAEATRVYGSNWGDDTVALEHVRDTLGKTRDALHAESVTAGLMCNERDMAYEERNALVCLLSKLFPACLLRHQPHDDDWDDDWRNIVCIDLPTGQATWHIHDSLLEAFGHLDYSDCIEWDGHSSTEKYVRVAEVPVASTETIGLLMTQLRAELDR